MVKFVPRVFLFRGFVILVVAYFVINFLSDNGLGK